MIDMDASTCMDLVGTPAPTGDTFTPPDGCTSQFTSRKCGSEQTLWVGPVGGDSPLFLVALTRGQWGVGDSATVDGTNAQCEQMP